MEFSTMSNIRHDILYLVECCQAAERVPEDLAYKKLLADYGDQLIPGLIACLHDYDSEVRWMTLVILGDGMEPKIDTFIPEIIDRLSDEDGLVQCAAVLALTEFGKSASPALEHSNSSCRMTLSRLLDSVLHLQSLELLLKIHRLFPSCWSH
jgi:HEAT repeat protein